MNSLLFLKLKNFERYVPTNFSLFSFIILAAESFTFKIFPLTPSSKNNGSSENSIKALYLVSKLLYLEYSLSNASWEFTNFFWISAIGDRSLPIRITFFLFAALNPLYLTGNSPVISDIWINSNHFELDWLKSESFY